ncbi:MAG: Mo-dependent nitrogenase C-terminal domain-containing protein [Cyanobacteria bacterium P01_A01_bin.84]
MKVFDNTKQTIFLASWISADSAEPSDNSGKNLCSRNFKLHCDVLKPLRQWLDNIQISDRKLAHRLCQLIPSQCPFERDINIFDKTLFHIPPLCKLNPLYEELVSLRFRALCYLADECGEDIAEYC